MNLENLQTDDDEKGYHRNTADASAVRPGVDGNENAKDRENEDDPIKDGKECIHIVVVAQCLGLWDDGEPRWRRRRKGDLRRRLRTLD